MAFDSTFIGTFLVSTIEQWFQSVGTEGSRYALPPASMPSKEEVAVMDDLARSTV